jgi:hypothetical protein
MVKNPMGVLRHSDSGFDGIGDLMEVEMAGSLHLRKLAILIIGV